MKYKSLAELYGKLESTSKRLEKTKILSEFLKKVPDSDLERVYLLIQGKTFPEYDERKIGVAAKIIIKAIAVATGKSNPEIIHEWKKIGDLGEVSFIFSGTKSQKTLFSASLSVKKVFDNLYIFLILSPRICYYDFFQ